MNYRVELRPSRRVFFAQTHESLLEAALRSGVNVPYNCTSGSCGKCRARLIHGKLAALGFQDFAFSEAEKSQNMFLLCTRAAASDLALDVQEAADASAIPEQFLRARVNRIEPLKGGVLLHLRTPRTQTLRFLAGQWVRLRFADGSEAELAVASCPCNGMALQFLLSSVPPLAVGDTVELRGPYGCFVLDESSHRPLWLIAEGVDFAPIKSLVEHALTLELAQAIRLVWIAERGQHGLANHARALADAVDTFSFVPLERTSGVIEALSALVNDAPSSDVYVAARGLADAIAGAFIASGTPPARLFRYRA